MCGLLQRWPAAIAAFLFFTANACADYYRQHRKSSISSGTAPMDSQTVRLGITEPDDVILGCELIGAGPARIMVFNDWLTDCSSWTPMHPYLDTTRFTYAFVDLRGYGRSRAFRGRYDVNEAAGDAFTLADQLG